MPVRRFFRTVFVPFFWAARRGPLERCILAAAIFRRVVVADCIQSARLAHPRDDLWLCRGDRYRFSAHRNSQLDRPAAGQWLSVGRVIRAVVGRPRRRCRLCHLGSMGRGRNRRGVPRDIRGNRAARNHCRQQLAQSPCPRHVRRADCRQYRFPRGGNPSRQRRLWRSYRHCSVDRADHAGGGTHRPEFHQQLADAK